MIHEHFSNNVNHFHSKEIPSHFSIKKLFYYISGVTVYQNNNEKKKTCLQILYVITVYKKSPFQREDITCLLNQTNKK